MIDQEARDLLEKLTNAVTKVSERTVTMTARAEATLALFTQVAADVMGMQPDQVAYVQSLRLRTLDKLPKPGTDPAMDQMLIEIERILGKMETARRLS